MKIENYIANRYLYKGNSGFSTVKVISVLAFLGVTIGISAIIIISSVFGGFQKYTLDSLKDESPNFVISSPNESLILDLLSDSVQFSLESKTDILIFDKKPVPALKKSYLVPDYYKGESLGKIHLEGISSGQSTRKLSSDIYSQIGYSGDTLLYYQTKFLEASINFGMPMLPQQFQYTGFFIASSNEKKPIVAEVTKARSNQLYLNNINDLSNFNISIWQENFNPTDYQLSESTYKSFDQINSDLLFVLKLEKLFASFVMFLIVTIGIFNLIASLSIKITLKNKDLALLKAIGLSHDSIKKIFKRVAMKILLYGIIAGTLLGFSFYLTQTKTGLFKVNVPDAPISKIPVELELLQYSIAVIATVFLTLLLIKLPQRQIEKHHIPTALKSGL
ncbi:MAG: hypothetical protein Kapaf2KO_09490 [Candidatus Kapaibacteriales bacterium]